MNKYNELSATFIALINETGYNEREGYLLKLTFVVEKDPQKWKIAAYSLADKRASLKNKRRFEKKSKKHFEALLPEYLKLIDENDVAPDCKAIVFKIQLRLCY